MDGMANIATAATESQKQNEAMTKATADTASSLDGDFQKMLRSMVAPESSEKLYNKTVKEAGVNQKQESVNNFTNQLNAITAQRDAQKLSLVGQGRGITETIIGGQQAALDREAAIRSLPIAAQLSAAQNDLAAAKDQVNTLFQIRSEDARSKADYQNKIATAIYQYATEKQKLALDAKTKIDDRSFQLQMKNLDFARDLAGSAISNGQPTLAAQLMNLDHTSPSYQASVASLAKGIAVPQKSSSSSKADTGLRESIADAADAVVGGDYSYSRALARLRTLYPETTISMGDLTNMLDYAIDPATVPDAGNNSSEQTYTPITSDNLNQYKIVDGNFVKDPNYVAPSAELRAGKPGFIDSITRTLFGR